MVVLERGKGKLQMVYEISNFALSAKVSETGGELLSIRNKNGREFIWQGNPDYWRGHSPILFPICGSLRNNQARLRNGKMVNLSRHGFARKMIFTCDFAGEEKAQFTLVSNETTFDDYPFPFSLVIRYELKGASVETRYIVTNTGGENMPFFIGGHPGFCCPVDKNASFEDYLVEFEHEETCTIPAPVLENGLIDMGSRRRFLDKQKVIKLTNQMFDNDAIILDQLHSRRVQLIHKDRTHGVELEFYDFPYLILWSVPGAAFVALEPWSGLSTCNDEGDIFEDKRNVMILKSGESRTYRYTIKLLS